MGTDMQSIQNAYQGFAKSNYTMLDNLKLGYGGTKEEMQRLLEDAEKISGIEYDISSYSDVIDAIHVVQEEMDIAGTTQKEASETISGSVAATKAAWDNLVTGLANGNANLGPLIDNLVSTASTAANNIIPVLSQALTGAATLIQEMVPVIMQEIPTFISETLPTLVESGVSIITAIIDGIAQNSGELVTAFADTLMALVDGVTEAIPVIIDAVATIVPEVVIALAEAAPDLLESGLALIEALAEGIMDSIPTLVESLPAVIEAIVGAILEGIPMIIETGVELLTALVENLPTIISTITAALPEIITNITETLLDHIDEIIDAGIELLTAIIEDLPTIIETIIEAIPEIVTAILQAFAEKGPDLVTAGFDLFVKLIENLPTIIIEIVKAVPEIVKGIVEKFDEKGPDMIEAGKNLLMGIWNGIDDKIEWLKGKVAGVVDKIKSWFEGPEGFDEHSPSKWARRVFEYVMEGGALGIEDGLPYLEKAINKTSQSVKDSLSKSLADADSTSSKITEMVAGITAGIEKLNYDADLGIADAVVKSTDPSKGGKFITDYYESIGKEAESLAKSFADASKTYEEFENKVLESKGKAISGLEKDRQKVIADMIKEREDAAKEVFNQYDFFGGAESTEKAKRHFEEIKTAADEVFSQFSIFDSAEKEDKKVSGSSLIKGLENQIKQTDDFYSNLEELSERGADESLVKMIRDMGVGASAELDALINMSDEELEKYLSLYAEKTNQAKEIGEKNAEEAGESITGETLISNLKDQIESTESWYSKIESLAERGAGEDFISAITDMGVGASAELDALTSMTDEQLEEYLSLFAEKGNLATNIADKQMGFDPDDPEKNFQAGLDSVNEYFDDRAEEIGASFDAVLTDSVVSGIPAMLEEVGAAVEESVNAAQGNVAALYNDDMTAQQVLLTAHEFTRKRLTKHFIQFTPFADPDFHTMPAGWDPNSLEVRSSQWMSADRNKEHETTVNLVLPDGSKLAQYVFNPMVDYANANGTPIVNPQT